MKIDKIEDVTKENIIARASDLSKFVLRTPTIQLSSERLKTYLSGAEIYLKLECMQHTGTFKARGAISVALQIPTDEVKFGITAASAGNHAIASSWAARQIDTTAKVVMANTANPYRVEQAKRYGGEIILKEPGKALFDEAERLVEKEMRTFIHPFEGINTTLGASGVGLELMDDIKNLDAVVVSVGGGGLISGVSAAVKAINSKCKVYGVEPIGADSMSKSITAGKPVTLSSTDTIADSLSPPMALPFGFQLCKKNVDKIVLVSDHEICSGMTLLMEEGKLAVEPAAGAVMAGIIFRLREQLMGKKIGLIVCGSNIDAKTYNEFNKRGSKHLANFNL